MTDPILIKDTIIFKTKPSGDATRVIKDCGAEDSEKRVPVLRLAKAYIPEYIDKDSILVLFKSHPDVEWARFEIQANVNALYHATKGDDPYVEYHLKRQSVYRAWQILGNKGSSSVIIGQVDSGVVIGHPDIATPTYQRNTTTDTDDATDTTCWYMFVGNGMSHGTYIQSYMVSPNNNGVGVTGVAPGCSIATVATGDGETVGPWGTYDLIEGIIWCVDNGARAINCSWGWVATQDDVDLLQDAIDYAWDADSLCVAAYGNNNLDFDSPSVPLMVPNANVRILQVGGAGSVDQKYVSSNYGSDVDCVSFAYGAPSHHLWGANNAPPGSSYPYRDGGGTSFAAPQIVAIIGLMLSANADLTAQQMVDTIHAARDISLDSSFTSYFRGATCGITNAAKAVLIAKTLDSANDGEVYPYVGFWKMPTYNQTGDSLDGPYALMSLSNGVLTTTLSGNILIDITGFSSDTVTSVELWLGNTKLYDGIPCTIQATAASNGSPLTLKVVANTATTSAEEEYTDIIVDSLSLTSYGGITLPQVSMEVQISVPVLIGLRAGLIAFPTASLVPQVTAPTLSGTAIGGFTMPTVEMQISISILILTGTYSGLFVIPQAELAPQILVPSLNGIRAGPRHWISGIWSPNVTVKRYDNGRWVTK